MTWRVAIGSADGVNINCHFGHCASFWIYQITEDGACCFFEQRYRQEQQTAHAGHHEQSLQAAADELSDCAYVLVSRIGPGAKAALYERGVLAMAIEAPIELALKRLSHFLRSGRESLLH